jgi:hypothetical protein
MSVLFTVGVGEIFMESGACHSASAESGRVCGLSSGSAGFRRDEPEIDVKELFLRTKDGDGNAPAQEDVLPRSASDESADRVMHDSTAPNMDLHNSPVMHTVTVPAERNAEPRVSRLTGLLAQQPLAVLTAISVLICVALLVIGTPQIYVGVEGYDARSSQMARVVDGYSFAERRAREYMAATGGLPQKTIENTKQVYSI